MKIKLNNVVVKSIACAVPSLKIGLEEFGKEFGFNEVKRISLSTGITSVRVVKSLQKTSDFCFEASKKLFEANQISPDSIDAIIFISQTPDYQMPATSCVLQHRLGLPKTALAFDINYGCSAYIYGLYQASLLITSGSCKKVLLCTGDVMTPYLNPSDQKTRLVFGDGGSATLIQEGHGTMAFNIMTDGSGYKSLMIDRKNDGSNEYLFMNGAEIMEFALREVPATVDDVVEQMEWKKQELDLVVFHQANQFIVDYLRKKIGLPKEIVPIVVNGYGNTGPASIPLALCHQGKGFSDKEGKKAILSGFGVGLSWGSVALDLSATKMIDIIEI